MALGPDGTEGYVSVMENSRPVIIKIDTTTTSNGTIIGKYQLPINISQLQFYNYVYLIRGYLMACTQSYPCRMFNESTMVYITDLLTDFYPIQG